MRRALLCDCGCHLEAWDEEELVSEVLVHLGQEHPVMDQQQEEAQVHERVAAHSYRYEYLEEVYAGGTEPDEEFGLDPY
jgi:predicted small metal-binding protein